MQMIKQLGEQLQRSTLVAPNKGHETSDIATGKKQLGGLKEVYYNSNDEDALKKCSHEVCDDNL